jgi:LysR family transcriptional regulator for metE and metH
MPHLVTVVEVTDAVIELIASDFGVSILSRWAVQSAIKNKTVSAISLGKEKLHLDWSALIRESEAASSAARLVSRRLAEWFTV